MNDQMHGRRRIALVVDDDDAIRQALHETLLEEDFLVATAGSGFEALEFLNRYGPVDVALVDLLMPEMDGSALIRALRRRSDCSELPVVVMSAGGERALAQAPPAAAYLTKPLSVTRLLDAIRQSIADRESAAPSRVRSLPRDA